MRGARITTAADWEEHAKRKPAFPGMDGKTVGEILAATGRDPREEIYNWELDKRALQIEIDASTTMPDGAPFGPHNTLEKYTG